MRILYIAYSCSPFNGSEDKIGWNIPIDSAKTNHVYVITKEEHRNSIENYLSNHHLENIEFYFVDIPKFYKKVYNGALYSGRLNIWHQRVFSLAKKICKEKKIEIIHQITPIEFRAIGNYGKIQDIKFVCGPLGGGESIPHGLKSYAKGHQFIEAIRMVVNYWYRHQLRIFGKIKRCDYVMFANKETQSYLCGDSLRKIGDSNSIVSEIGLGNEELLEEYDKNNMTKECCVFLVAGRLVYRKGHKLLLDALLEIPDTMNYVCSIVGDGPEMKKLKKYCSQNEKLSKHVVFRGRVPYVDMVDEYKKADVFIMPSIRETTGTVILEAMSKGIPVITINRFGGAEILDDSVGWGYDGINKESYIRTLSQIIMTCISNPSEVKIRGDNARKYVEYYTWNNKNQLYQNVYFKLLNK